MDFPELVFSATQGALSRFRWFLLTTTLGSTLVLVHIYLEQFGTHKSQLEGAIVRDLCLEVRQKMALPATPLPRSVRSEKVAQPSTESEFFQGRMAELRSDEAALIARLVEDGEQRRNICGSDPAGASAGPVKDEKPKDKIERFKKDVDRLAEKKVIYQTTLNTLKDRKLRDRKLPLLDLDVDANDYFPAMALLLDIMVAAVWLSAESIAVTLQKLHEIPGGKQYVEAAKLSFTFLFPNRKDSGSGWINHWLLNGAMWLPAISLVIAIAIEMGSAYYHRTGVLPDSLIMVLRWVCLLGSIAWSATFAVLSMRAMGRVQATVSASRS